MALTCLGLFCGNCALLGTCDIIERSCSSLGDCWPFCASDSFLKTLHSSRPHDPDRGFGDYLISVVSTGRRMLKSLVGVGQLLWKKHTYKVAKWNTAKGGKGNQLHIQFYNTKVTSRKITWTASGKVKFCPGKSLIGVVWCFFGLTSHSAEFEITWSVSRGRCWKLSKNWLYSWFGFPYFTLNGLWKTER